MSELYADKNIICISKIIQTNILSVQLLHCIYLEERDLFINLKNCSSSKKKHKQIIILVQVKNKYYNLFDSLNKFNEINLKVIFGI